jgi:hypothetical protein
MDDRVILWTLPNRLQEMSPFFGQGVDAPPAPARGLHEPALSEVAEVFVDGRQRYPESLRQLVPVDGSPAERPIRYLRGDAAGCRGEGSFLVKSCLKILHLI